MEPRQGARIGPIAVAAEWGTCILEAMFKDIQRVFKQTWDAFRSEAAKREPEDQVADLLSSMRRELVGARAALPVLAEEVQRTRAELAREHEATEKCERRGAMAARIGDEETARVAGEFAARHRERAGILEKRLDASEAELTLRTREAEEMKRKYQEADANRFAILAQLRRAETQQRMASALDGTDGAFADFRRMEETVDDESARVDALEELDGRGDAGPVRSAHDVEEQLRELKRRMGKEQ